MDRDVIFEGGWYVLVVAARAEAKVVDMLIGMGADAYSPTETVWRKGSKNTRFKRELVQRPLLPRYVFVELKRGGLQFHHMRGLKLIERLVSICGKPSRIPEITVRRLRADEADGLFSLAKSFEPKRGDSVRIVDGPLVGRTAKVLKARQGAKQIKVLLDKLDGVAFKIDVAIADVEDAA